MIRRLLTIILLSISLHTVAQSEYDFELSKSLDIYAELLQKLNLYYVDPLEPATLNQTAIEAALKQLDPYTVYYPESQMEDVAFMHSGKYGGIGASTLIRNDSIYVDRILKGYSFDKAGIASGDVLLSIDGESLTGKSRDELSDLLQGSEGSDFKLEYLNPYSGQRQTKKIIREEIEVQNVSYSALIGEGIAFVRLEQFKQDAAADIKKALDSLNGIQPLKGVVLDLRGNPGGLLIEAVHIVNLFVGPGLEVVTTKGKVEQQNKKYATSRAAAYPNAKVVVLVSGSSASASEIVAGGIQDLDRGIVLGQKSFGKGLVQNVMPLSYHAQVKITIAKYYIPSGRCIQAIDYSHKKNGKAEKIPDSLYTTYYTKGGRPVKDAGGILPDVKMDKHSYAEVTRQLLKEYVIYDFANYYYNQHKDKTSALDAAIGDDQMFADFKAFAKRKGFHYKPDAEKHLSAFIEASEDEDYSSSISTSLDQIKAELKKLSDVEMNQHQQEIMSLVYTEIAARFAYAHGRVKTSLQYDKEVEKAIELINNETTYSSYLKI